MSEIYFYYIILFFWVLLAHELGHWIPLSWFLKKGAKVRLRWFGITVGDNQTGELTYLQMYFILCCGVISGYIVLLFQVYDQTLFLVYLLMSSLDIYQCIVIMSISKKYLNYKEKDIVHYDMIKKEIILKL